MTAYYSIIIAHGFCVIMCMGLGCNAVGVTGCRIIDSKRERLAAILTNSFIPCNGRFPALIAVISMFVYSGGFGLVGCAVLIGAVLMGIFATFAVTFLLTKTILRGTPSAFTLELPPYRRPKIRSLIVRSVFDRTVFVLGRALSVAAPAGFAIWFLANIRLGSFPLISYLVSALEPVGAFMGLDGEILTGFILGLPANEIVLPISVMCYTGGSQVTAYSTVSAFRDVLVSNGWGLRTAVCMIVFIIFHSPCATTLLTVKKETGKVRYMLLAFAIPVVIGFVLCSIIYHI